MAGRRAQGKSAATPRQEQSQATPAHVGGLTFEEWKKGNQKKGESDVVVRQRYKARVSMLSNLEALVRNDGPIKWTQIPHAYFQRFNVKLEYQGRLRALLMAVPGMVIQKRTGASILE